jgi:AraC-like DNA-binding protein
VFIYEYIAKLQPNAIIMSNNIKAGAPYEYQFDRGLWPTDVLPLETNLPAPKEPTEVVVRRSTDILAIDDPELAAAIGFIRDHACEGISTEDVVRHVDVSYSTLCRRFRSTLKRSIHDEILRIRLDRVKELLVGTRLSLASVARKTGFEHQEYMGAVFKAHVGVTPNNFRSVNRPRPVDRVEEFPPPVRPATS